MVNWQDPYVLAMSARAFILVVHTFFGVYAWEIATSLDYDWLLLTGRKKFTASTAIYWLARYTTLVALIIGIRICNALELIDCQNWNYALHAFAYSATGFLSALLYLRVVALSGRNKLVIVSLGIFYVGYWSMVCYGIYHSEAVYVPELFLCAAIGLTAHRANTIVQFSFDLTCLALMMIFLLRGHRGGSLWTFLLQQGVVYLIVITLGYLIASAFLIANLNDAVSQAPNVFALLTNAICSTRMQRGLSEFYEPTRTWTTGASSATAPPQTTPRFPAASTGINVTVNVEHGEDAYPMHKYGERDVDSKHSLGVAL